MLFAALKRIKVDPVVELVNHWLHSIKTLIAIMCTSLITRLAASVDPHAANTYWAFLTSLPKVDLVL